MFEKTSNAGIISLLMSLAASVRSKRAVDGRYTCLIEHKAEQYGEWLSHWLQYPPVPFFDPP